MRRNRAWICVALLFIVVAAVAGLFYYAKIEDEKRADLSRRLIRPDEIVFTDTVLRQTYGTARGCS